MGRSHLMTLSILCSWEEITYSSTDRNYDGANEWTEEKTSRHRQWESWNG